MVHIIIKIDGTETEVTTGGGEVASATAQGAGATGEVLARAAIAATAQNAGAAPAGEPASTAAPPPTAAAEPGVPEAGTDALPAGAAPGTRLELSPTVITEEGE